MLVKPPPRFENFESILNLLCRLSRVRGPCAKRISVSGTTGKVRGLAKRKAEVDSFLLIPDMPWFATAFVEFRFGASWPTGFVSFVFLDFFSSFFFTLVDF